MKLDNSLRTALILTGILFLVFIVMIFYTHGIPGGGDSISHFQIARYTFKHPWLFFNHWGKPVFTILMAPFAQLGYQGAKLFNVTAGILTAFITYRTISKLGYDNTLPAIFLVLFTPIYVNIMFSALVEILFSLTLIFAIYSFVCRRFYLTAFIISFIPIIRNEGIIFLFIFISAFILLKKYRPLSLIFSGIIIISLLGMTVHLDPFWLFSQIPYNARMADIYGGGNFWEYFRDFDKTLGIPMIFLAIIGFVTMVLHLPKAITEINIKNISEYILIAGSLFIYLLVHSYLWWKGSGYVLADPRFVAGVAPLASILSFKGLSSLMRKIPNQFWRRSIQGFILAAIIIQPLILDKIPFRMQANFQTISMASEWALSNGYTKYPAIYFDPSFPFFMNIDPFSFKDSHKGFIDDENPYGSLPDSSMIYWDSHIAGYTNKLPLDSLATSENLELVNLFSPETDIKESFTGAPYIIAFFQKMPLSTRSQNEYILLSQQDMEPIKSSPGSLDTTYIYNDSLYQQGHYSLRMDARNNFSKLIEIPVSEIGDGGNILLKSSIWVYSLSEPELTSIRLVLEFRTKDFKIYRYLHATPGIVFYTRNKWQDITLYAPLKPEFIPGGSVRSYLWYTGKGEIMVDNHLLEVIIFK